MHKDSVHKTQHQVCSNCLEALNGSPLWVGGRKLLAPQGSRKGEEEQTQRHTLKAHVEEERTRARSTYAEGIWREAEWGGKAGGQYEGEGRDG